MAKADLLSILYSKEKSPLEFKFDSMWIPSMYNFLTPQDIAELHYLASSAKFSSKIDFKYKEIDRIMTNRGFKKFHCGTNRIVYSYLEDQSFLVKIALDKVGLTDNPAEYRNQFLLKPFVTKVFEVSPCGTVATVERVEPITSRQEFMSVAEDIFDLMNQCIIGKYVLEDVGTNYFMNWGLRKGFGAVLLDYTYVYELDGNKLFCNKVYPVTGEICNGVIDYDSGFNNLICSKCGKRYLAKSLEQSVRDKLIILKDEGEIEMKIKLQRGNEIVAVFQTNDQTDTIIRRPKRNFREEQKLNVSLSRGSNLIADNVGILPSYNYESDEQIINVSLKGGNRKNDYKKEKYNHQNENQKDREPVRSAMKTMVSEPKKNRMDEKIKETPVKDFDGVKKEQPVYIRDIPVVTADNISSDIEKSKEEPIYTRDIPVVTTNSFLGDGLLNKTELSEARKELEKENIEQIDMLSKLGLSDKDFEEPKDEEEVTKTESVSKNNNLLSTEAAEDMMAKYYEEYDEEVETYEKIKKGNKRPIMENY